MPQKRTDRSDWTAPQAGLGLDMAVPGAATAAAPEIAQPLPPAERDAEPGQTSLSEVAYLRILELLFAGGLPAGVTVSQNDLVRLVGVPVAPLRDALRVLQTEGLLTIHPRSGIRFLKADFEFAKNTYQFRGILERPAVRVFAEAGALATMERLRLRHVEAVETLARDGFTAAIMREMVLLDEILHFEIISALGNPLVESTYRRVHNYLQLIRLDRRLTGPLALRTLREHLDLLDACLARDPDRAETSLQLHFTLALQRTMGIF